MAFQTLSQIKQGSTQPKAQTSSFKTITQLKAGGGKVGGFQTISQIKGIPSSTLPKPIQIANQPEDLATKVYNALPGTMQTLSELQLDPLSLKANPKKAIGDAWEALKGSVVEEGQRIKDYVDEYKQYIKGNRNPNELLGKELKARTGIANVAFSPISAIFAGVNDIPVLGSISKLITLPFSVAGEGATVVSNNLVDKLPISQEAKDSIKPGVGEMFALAAQIALGKAVEVGGKKFTELKGKYGVEDATTIVTKANELAKEMPKNDISTISPKTRPLESTTTISEAKITPKTVEVPREQLPVGGGEQKVSRLEARMKGVLDNADPEITKNLSTYESMKKPEQIKMASDYVTKFPEDALKVLSGEKEAPPGLLKNSIYVAMDNLAQGDVNLATKLATLASTRAGQEISILTELNPDSPVKLMKEVIDVRAKAFEQKTGKTVTKAIDDTVRKMTDEVKKARPKVQDWSDFVREIECGG